MMYFDTSVHSRGFDVVAWNRECLSVGETFDVSSYYQRRKDSLKSVHVGQGLVSLIFLRCQLCMKGKC